MKNIRNFYLKIFIILVGKFSVYLNRHVFVMDGIFSRSWHPCLLVLLKLTDDDEAGCQAGFCF